MTDLKVYALSDCINHSNCVLKSFAYSTAMAYSFLSILIITSYNYGSLTLC